MDENFIMMPVPASAFRSVCALLGGSTQTRAPQRDLGNATANLSPPTTSPADEKPLDPAQSGALASGNSAPANADTGEIDAAGHPWSEALHASTKGKTKDGLWRMKVGVSRPVPVPGFPKDAASSAGATGTQSNGTGSQAGGSATGPNAGPVTPDQDADEFAAFRAAADKASATDANAAASVPARKWSDSDLSALCNQAATKLNDPTPVREVIAKFVPEGQVQHSRCIPEASREAFAKAIEEKAGITFAG